MNQLLEDRAEFKCSAWGCSFTVHGLPQPGGSKRLGRHPTSQRAVIIDANRKAAPWKQDVQVVAGTLMRNRPLYEGPLSLEVTFFLPRPKGHYGAGGVRRTAPKYPTVKPDTTKLLRPMEDALTGILWKDDAQIVDQRVRKRYCATGEEPRVEIMVLVIV